MEFREIFSKSVFLLPKSPKFIEIHVPGAWWRIWVGWRSQWFHGSCHFTCVQRKVYGIPEESQNCAQNTEFYIFCSLNFPIRNGIFWYINGSKLNVLHIVKTFLIVLMPVNNLSTTFSYERAVEFGLLCFSNFILTLLYFYDYQLLLGFSSD